MSNKKPITSILEIVTQFRADVKKFGTYTMQDKGASEIHDFDPDIAYLKTLTGEEAGKKLAELLDSTELQEDEMATCLVRSLIVCLDDELEEWFDAMLDADPRLQPLY